MTGLRWLISLGLAMARLAPMALRGMANCAAVGPASTLNDRQHLPARWKMQVSSHRARDSGRGVEEESMRGFSNDP